jgi:translation elongation factor EF-Tu-like GTPase
MSLFTVYDDFEAEITIIPEAEGGRRAPTYNGVRWDFCYAEDDYRQGLWMIPADFVDADGKSLPRELALLVGVPLLARMVVLNDELRESVHLPRIAAGVRFFCHEGSKRVACGMVTRVTGLLERRRRRPKNE